MWPLRTLCIQNLHCSSGSSCGVPMHWFRVGSITWVERDIISYSNTTIISIITGIPRYLRANSQVHCQLDTYNLWVPDLVGYDKSSLSIFDIVYIQNNFHIIRYTCEFNTELWNTSVIEYNNNWKINKWLLWQHKRPILPTVWILFHINQSINAEPSYIWLDMKVISPGNINNIDNNPRAFWWSRIRKC